jgi:hypothetical protein
MVSEVMVPISPNVLMCSRLHGMQDRQKFQEKLPQN